MTEIICLGRSHFIRSRANLIQTLHMVNAWRAQGYGVRLYLPTVRRRGSVTARLESFGVSSRIDIRFSPLLKSRWQFRPFAWLHRRELVSARLIFTRAPEVSARLARLGIRHVLEVHDIDELKQKQLLALLATYHTQKVIQIIVGTSSPIIDALVAAGAERRRLLLASNGVDVDAYARVPLLQPEHLDQPRAVYLGRVTRDRGLIILAQLAREGLCDVTLVGDQDDRVDGPMKVVPFVAPREVPLWYERANMVLLPYQPDLAHANSISPIKLFEAMAAGRPIVISNLPAIRDVAIHERNALLVEPCDVDAWRCAIRRLHSDRDLALRLAAQARQDVQERSWRARATRIFDAASWA